MKREFKISINKEWAKKAGKAKVVSALSNAYSGIDIGAEYDKIIPPKEEKKEIKKD